MDLVETVQACRGRHSIAHPRTKVHCPGASILEYTDREVVGTRSHTLLNEFHSVATLVFPSHLWTELAGIGIILNEGISDEVSRYRGSRASPAVAILCLLFTIELQLTGETTKQRAKGTGSWAHGNTFIQPKKNLAEGELGATWSPQGKLLHGAAPSRI